MNYGNDYNKSHGNFNDSDNDNSGGGGGGEGGGGGDNRDLTHEDGKTRMAMGDNDEDDRT